AARELDHLLDVREAGDHLAVDPDLADLVHDHGDGLAPKPVRQHVPEERRLPTAEEAGEDIDGNRPHQTSGRPASPSGTGCPSRWSSVGATSSIETSARAQRRGGGAHALQRTKKPY